MKKDKCFFKYPEFDNIKQIIYNSVEKYPDCNAFTIKEKLGEEIKYKNITYKEFLKNINSFGTGLFNLGMKDKRIAIISKNRYEWGLSYVSVLLGNMIAVPLDKALTLNEIESSLIRSKADMIIFDDGLIDIIKQIRSNGKTNIKEYICMDKSEEFKNVYDILKSGEKLIEEGNTDYINAEIDSYEMRILVFTSGTTSEAKAVMLTHKNIAYDIYAMNLVEDFRNTDVNLAFLPFHHTFGSTGLLVMLSKGVSTVFPDGLRYIAQNLKEYGVSVFVGVPLLIESMYKKIEKEVEKQGKTKLIKTVKKATNILLKCRIDIRRKVFKQIIDQLGGKLRYIVSGAASLDKEVAKGFNDFGILLVQGYGLTETAPVAIAENVKYRKYGSVGFPMKDSQVKIVDKNEEGIGEIVLKGPNVMLGYYENEEATNEVLKDGWFYTGDFGYIDTEGFVFITGRKKNVIILKNGKNIYPEELENVINKLEIVKESMVFGMPKEDDVLVSVKIQYDEEIVNEKYPNISKEDLIKIVWEKIKEVNKTMPTYKYIKNMILTSEEFVKTTTAKIKRHEEIKKICPDL